MIKITTQDAIQAFKLIENAKYDKMEKQHKSAILRVRKALKSIVASYDDFYKDVAEKLRPDNFDKLVAKEHRKEEFSDEEKEILGKYNTEIAECLKPELEKEIEMDAEPLAEDAVIAICESNAEWTFGVMGYLSDVVGEK